MMKRFFLLNMVFFLFLNGCKQTGIDSTENNDLHWEGDTITIPVSPVENPYLMEMWGFAVRKNDIDAFTRQLGSNQYAFKGPKGKSVESYEKAWGMLFKKYLVIMYAKNNYIGEPISFNINNGLIRLGIEPVRTFHLDYIFHNQRDIPHGSGVATLLDAEVGQEYQMIWLLVSHGSDEEQNLSTITYLNKDEALQAKSLYTITSALEQRIGARVVRSS